MLDSSGKVFLTRSAEDPNNLTDVRSESLQAGTQYTMTITIIDYGEPVESVSKAFTTAEFKMPTLPAPPYSQRPGVVIIAFTAWSPDGGNTGVCTVLIRH